MFQFPANPTVGQQFAAAPGVTYEWNGTGWVFLGLNTASLYPPGVVLPYAGVNVNISGLPFQGWLLCDGKNYPSATYPALFAIIGSSFGSSGVGMFAVPDLRGMVIAGVDNMGGAARGMLTPSGSGIPNTTIVGGAGSTESIALTPTQLPSHAHGIADVLHGHSVGDPQHVHAIADPGHIHHVPDPAHTHAANDPSHVHAIPGEQAIGLHLTPGSGSMQFNSGDRAGVVVPAAATAAALTGINIGVSGTGINNTDPAGTGIGISGSATGISIGSSGTGLSTTAPAGSGGSFPRVQPTLLMNYIIKT